MSGQWLWVEVGTWHMLAVVLRIPWRLQFSLQDFASFGLGYLCRSSAPRDAGAWGAMTLAKLNLSSDDG